MVDDKRHSSKERRKKKKKKKVSWIQNLNVPGLAQVNPTQPELRSGGEFTIGSNSSWLCLGFAPVRIRCGWTWVITHTNPPELQPYFMNSSFFSSSIAIALLNCSNFSKCYVIIAFCSSFKWNWPSCFCFFFVDPARFRFTHQTSFVRRHAGVTRTPGLRWIVRCISSFSLCNQVVYFQQHRWNLVKYPRTRLSQLNSSSQVGLFR